MYPFCKEICTNEKQLSTYSNLNNNQNCKACGDKTEELNKSQTFSQGLNKLYPFKNNAISDYLFLEFFKILMIRKLAQKNQKKNSPLTQIQKIDEDTAAIKTETTWFLICILNSHHFHSFHKYFNNIFF